jgi:hypothetical protein
MASSIKIALIHNTLPFANPCISHPQYFDHQKTSSIHDLRSLPYTPIALPSFPQRRGSIFAFASEQVGSRFRGNDGIWMPIRMNEKRGDPQP